MIKSESLRKILTIAGPVVIALGLLYLAFRGTDTGEFWSVLRDANYYWLIPLAFATFLSHWLRAYRWTIFMNAVPGHAGDRFSNNTAFGALMVGYMVNYATTRLGEVVRSVIVSRKEGISFSAVVGTVVLDRVIDVVTLAIALISVVFIVGTDDQVLADSVFTPAMERISAVPVYVWLLVSIVAVTIAVLAIRVLTSRSTRTRSIVRDFRDGLMTIARSDRPVAIALTTILMWVCYASMAYMPLLVLQFESSYDISIRMAWIVMNVGALGVVVPTPGGIGSYHYITILIMTAMFAISQADAAAYAFLTHGAQLVLYTLIGFAYVIYFGMGLRFTRITAEDAEVQDDAATTSI
ncbi:MAG: flippase-like domain-containing protein [Rhodothermales bacterium]|nr:flippase-like domain-containing protein [Rhodothermales bacterium]